MNHKILKVVYIMPYRTLVFSFCNETNLKNLIFKRIQISELITDSRENPATDVLPPVRVMYLNNTGQILNLTTYNVLK